MAPCGSPQVSVARSAEALQRSLKTSDAQLVSLEIAKESGSCPGIFGFENGVPPKKTDGSDGLVIIFSAQNGILTWFVGLFLSSRTKKAG